MDKNTSVTFYVNKKRHFAFLKRKQRKILRFVVTEFVKTCDDLVIAFESSNNFGGLSSSTNCQLSNIPTKNLLSQDLISDSSWNIYEQLDNGNGGTCGDSIGGNICYVKERYGYRHFRQGFYSFLQKISFPY